MNTGTGRGARRTEFRWILVTAFILALGGVTVLPLDNRLSIGIRIEDLPGDLKRSAQLMEVIGHGTGMWIIVIGLLVLRPDLWRGAVTVLLSCGLAGLLANLVKLLVWRYRPAHFMPDLSLEDDSWSALREAANSSGTFWNTSYNSGSFPSGHSATAFALAICLGALFPRGRWYFLLLACLAGLHRVLAHSHWPSDVFAGAFLGTLAAGAVLIATQRWREPDRSEL